MILTLQPEFAGPGVSASPGACYLCNAAKRVHEPAVVDFHLQVDVSTFDGSAIDGWMQCCWSCATEIGRLVGMIDADQAEALRAELAVEQARRLTAEQHLDEADRALDAMKMVRARRAPAEDAE